jgi:hypothetical protein
LLARTWPTNGCRLAVCHHHRDGTSDDLLSTNELRGLWQGGNDILFDAMAVATTAIFYTLASWGFRALLPRCRKLECPVRRELPMVPKVFWSDPAPIANESYVTACVSRLHHDQGDVQASGSSSWTHELATTPPAPSLIPSPPRSTPPPPSSAVTPACWGRTTSPVAHTEV